MQDSPNRPNQGFQQAEEEHLTSKLPETLRDTHLYFTIPEAKPLLPKQIIDYSLPKVLIKEVRIVKQSPELYESSLQTPSSPLERAFLAKRQHNKNAQSTLSKRFIDSYLYKIIYMKYYPGKVSDFQRKTNKKLKNEIQKICKNAELLFATYVIDINFLFEIGTHILRNLEVKQLVQDVSQTDSRPVSFQSKFEGGNLMYVFERLQQSNCSEPIPYFEYFLVLENDINTKGYGNWFYFSMQVKEVRKIKVNVMNMQKAFSFLGHGMRVAVFSVKSHEREGTGWRLGGYDYGYQRNELLKEEGSQAKYSTLSFFIDNPSADGNDTLFVASHIPYSYSKLSSHLDYLLHRAKGQGQLYLRKEILASSVSCNECSLLTMTFKKEKGSRERGKKKVVLLMARQHPSEVVASYVMEGLLDELVSQSQSTTASLLEKYIFKVIPMVNIDGVIYGNSRCDLVGSDINRKWKRTVNPTLHPIVFAVQKLVASLVAEGHEIEYFVDLHGHSQKLGSFIYGCQCGDEAETRLFSWIMSKICPQFSYENCRFGLNSQRRQTARGFMLLSMPNRKSMTLQTSTFGFRHDNSLKQFDIKDLHNIGRSLLQAMHIDTFRNDKLINWASVRQEIKAVSSKSSKDEQLSSMQSDSNPDADELTLQQKLQTFLSPQFQPELEQAEEEALLQPKGLGHHRSQDSLLHLKGFSQDKAQNKLPNDKQMCSEILKKISKGTGRIELKESKSVTKVVPFKLHSREKKSLSVGRKIRIAVQFQREDLREQGNQETGGKESFPVIGKQRGSFWSSLKKECESLINQKKSMVVGLLPLFRPQKFHDT